MTPLPYPTAGMLPRGPPPLPLVQALLGKMRCLASLSEWENLSNLCRSEWRKSELHVRCGGKARRGRLRQAGVGCEGMSGRRMAAGCTRFAAAVLLGPAPCHSWHCFWTQTE